MKFADSLKDIEISIMFGSPVFAGHGKHRLRIYGIGTHQETGEPALIIQPIGPAYVFPDVPMREMCPACGVTVGRGNCSRCVAKAKAEQGDE